MTIKNDKNDMRFSWKTEKETGGIARSGCSDDTAHGICAGQAVLTTRPMESVQVRLF